MSVSLGPAAAPSSPVRRKDVGWGTPLKGSPVRCRSRSHDQQAELLAGAAYGTLQREHADWLAKRATSVDTSAGLVVASSTVLFAAAVAGMATGYAQIAAPVWIAALVFTGAAFVTAALALLAGHALLDGYEDARMKYLEVLATDGDRQEAWNQAAELIDDAIWRFSHQLSGRVTSTKRSFTWLAAAPMCPLVSIVSASLANWSLR